MTETTSTEPADDFTPVRSPSLAALHRQWLDRGLPASTWPTWLARWRETNEPIQPKHPHPNGGSCWTHSMCEAREALDKLTQHMERHHADTRTEWAALVERLAEAVADPFS